MFQGLKTLPINELIAVHLTWLIAKIGQSEAEASWKSSELCVAKTVLLLIKL